MQGSEMEGFDTLSLRRSSASWRRREKGERSRIDVPNERIHFLLGERQVLEMPQGVDGAHEAHDCDEGARVVHIVRIRQVLHAPDGYTSTSTVFMGACAGVLGVGQWVPVV